MGAVDFNDDDESLYKAVNPQREMRFPDAAARPTTTAVAAAAAAVEAMGVPELALQGGHSFHAARRSVQADITSG